MLKNRIIRVYFIRKENGNAVPELFYKNNKYFPILIILKKI